MAKCICCVCVCLYEGYKNQNHCLGKHLFLVFLQFHIRSMINSLVYGLGEYSSWGKRVCVCWSSIDFSLSPAKSRQTPLQNGEWKKLNITVAVSVAVPVDTCCHSSWHGQNAHGKRPPLGRQLLTLATHTDTLAQGVNGGRNLENIVKLWQQLRQQTSTPAERRQTIWGKSNSN